MSEIPAKATAHQEPAGRIVWQSSPPGSIYDYIKVASFSIGPDGLVDQWSDRAERLFGIRAQDVLGRDPIDAFVPGHLRERGHRKMAEILDGKEWTGVLPVRLPAPRSGEAAPGAPVTEPATTPTPAPLPTTPRRPRCARGWPRST